MTANTVDDRECPGCGSSLRDRQQIATATGSAVKVKVYGWQGMRHESPGTHRQTREIVAARSKAEVARIAGVKGPNALFNLGETGNAAEIAVATGKPGTIFWRPIDTRDKRYVEAGQPWDDGRAA